MAVSWATDAGIALDHGADVPIGVQLDWGIRSAIAAGRMRPGERLPALRELAEELGVNHNTLRAAVARLEAAGLLERRHGSGTFVAQDAAAHERQAPLVEQVMRSAADAGLSPRELAAALYVAGDGAPAERDPAADERRGLREDITMLERMLAGLEAQMAELDIPEAPARRPGPRLLTTDELREQRAALVLRLADAQRALDGDDDPPSGATAEAEAPAPERARRPRPAPVVRPQPT